MDKQPLLNELIEFIKFTHLFQKINRIVFIPGEDRFENDAEHSYQLAMTAWYLIEHEKLNLDASKAIAYKRRF